MGCFSWVFCDKGPVRRKNDTDVYARPKKEQRLMIGEEAYVLIPKEFGGGHIYESRYDGYGNFGGKDIFELVADWNREWLSKHPEWVPPFETAYAKRDPKYGQPQSVSSFGWYKPFADQSLSREEVVLKWKESRKSGPFAPEYRQIGIDISCWNINNEAIKYPIKIASSPDSVYEDCPFSYDDPGQGCK